ncbi:MAG TPA: hypothetical protein VGD65_25205 [Chryseosolibacter sp.]
MRREGSKKVECQEAGMPGMTMNVKEAALLVNVVNEPVAFMHKKSEGLPFAF